MATGQRAFAAKSKASLIAAIVKEQPRPISEIQPLTPPAFEHVVAKCLAKDPEDRWQSARDVAQELRWIGEGGSQAGVPAPVIATRRPASRLAWSVATIAAVVAVAATVIAWRIVSEHRGAAGDAILGAEHDLHPSHRNVRNDRHLAGRTGDRLLGRHRHVEDVVSKTDRPLRGHADRGIRWRGPAVFLAGRKVGGLLRATEALEGSAVRRTADGDRARGPVARRGVARGRHDRVLSVLLRRHRARALVGRRGDGRLEGRSRGGRAQPSLAARTSRRQGHPLLDRSGIVVGRRQSGRAPAGHGRAEGRAERRGRRALCAERASRLRARHVSVRRGVRCGRARGPRTAFRSHLRGRQPQRGRRGVRVLAKRHARVFLAGSRWR